MRNIGGTFADLQGKPAYARDAEQRRELLDGDRAPTALYICLISSPHNADLKILRAEALLPDRDAVGIGRKIGAHLRDRLRGNSEKPRNTHHRGPADCAYTLQC